MGNNLLAKIKILEKLIALYKALLKMRQKPEYIIFHHEAGENGFYSVNAYHKKKWNFESALGYYCGYQYFINNNGAVYQARKDNEEGAHCLGGYNSTSIGICVQGNLMKRDMTDGQKKSARKLIYNLQDKYNISNTKVLGHREARKGKTLCPGTYGISWLNTFRSV